MALLRRDGRRWLPSRRGIFFTIMALFVVTLIYIFFMSNQPFRVVSTPNPAGKSSSLDRSVSVNNHLLSLKSGLIKRAVLVSGYNALRSMQDYSLDQGTFISDLNGTFAEILINGSVGGTPLSAMGIDHMENTTLSFLLHEIWNLTVDFLKIDMNYTIHGVSIYQDNMTGPWQLGLSADVTLELNATVAEWTSRQAINVILPLEGHLDPLYSVSTGGLFNNTLHRTNITRWNVSYVKEFISFMDYRFEPDGPSYLMRLQNDTNSSNCCGIESLIYFESTKNMSFVDYCYFGEKCEGSNPNGTFSLYNITGITNESHQFKLEQYHIVEAKYNLTAQAVPTP
ncbi:MAG: hypothetical protein ABIC95_02605 [archaeon]